MHERVKRKVRTFFKTVGCHRTAGVKEIEGEVYKGSRVGGQFIEKRGWGDEETGARGRKA